MSYLNTPADIRALRRVSPWLYRFYVPSVIAIGCLPGTLLLVALGDWLGLACGWSVQPLYLGLLFYVVWKRNAALNRSVLDRRVTLTVEERSLHLVSNWGVAKFDWSLIKNIRESARHLFLFTINSEAFIVPRRAFESEPAFRDFVAAARQGHRLSREPAYVSFTPPGAAEVVSDVPGVLSALQVRFRNSAEELTILRLYGLARTALPWKNIRIWMAVGIVSAFITFLAWQRNAAVLGGETQTAWMYSFVLFLLLELLGIVFYVSCIAWLMRRRVNPYRLEWQTLTISPSGVYLRAPRCEHLCDWSAIDEFGENGRFMVLFLCKPRFLCAVPKSAFASRLECEQFLHLARQWKMRAADEASAGNAPPRLATENPYQSPEAC